MNIVGGWSGNIIIGSVWSCDVFVFVLYCYCGRRGWEQVLVHPSKEILTRCTATQSL